MKKSRLFSVIALALAGTMVLGGCGDSGSSDHRYAFFNDAVFGENGIPDSRTPQYGGELHGSDEEISKTASNGPD